MAKPKRTRGRVKWGAIERLAHKKNVAVRMAKGGERKLVGRDVNGEFRQLRIGHEWCNQPGAELPRSYVRKIKHVFGWTDEEIFNA